MSHRPPKSLLSQHIAALLVVTTLIAACSQSESAEKFEALGDLMTVDDVTQEFGDSLGEVRKAAPGAPPRVEGVQPSKGRGHRRALLTPAPTAVEYRIDIPEGGVLHVGTAVVRAEGNDRGGGVRFTARIGESTIFEREWHPGKRRDEHWQDSEVDLGEYAGTRRVLRLETAAVGRETPAGVPAWSRLQLVERSVRPRQRATPAAPNVLLLVVDTLRADRLGVYGASPTRTPNLDQLAAGGLVYQHAWAQAPWTLPSMATIFTGRYPREHGVVGRSARFGRPVGVGMEEEWAYLPDGLPTIASIAGRSGITTLGITSNLLISRENNLARGFETFIELPLSRGRTQWARAPKVNATFADWLEVNGTRRFFAYLHYMEPHDPYVPGEGAPECPAGAPADVCDGFVRNVAREREHGGSPVDPAVTQYLTALYDGEVRAWDAALPDLLAALDERGLRDRTVVIVTADHGEELGEHGHLGHRKQLYRESLSVPLVIAGPGIRPGRRSEIAQLADLLPTINALVGADAPSGLPGQNLLAEHPASRHTYAETRYGVLPGGVHSVENESLRTSQWAVLRSPAHDHVELYDHAADPGEQENRAPEDAHVAQQLTAQLDRFRAETQRIGDGRGSGAPITDKLRALGYVE